MSNVLIGIIGVILFIGLALAGALILGDDFKSASSSSQGAAIMSQLKQASDAADMYRLKTGRSNVPSTDTAFLVPRFLKTPAVNMTTAGSAGTGQFFWSVHFDNNMHGYDLPEPGYAAKYVYAIIGMEADQKARGTCQSITETYGIPAIADYSGNSDPHPPGESGCFLGFVLRSTDTNPLKAYFAYHRIAPASQSIVQPTG
jgi:hypothetical protein